MSVKNNAADDTQDDNQEILSNNMLMNEKSTNNVCDIPVDQTVGDGPVNDIAWPVNDEQLLHLTCL